MAEGSVQAGLSGAVTDVAALAALAAEEDPDGVALIQVGGRSLTWAGLDDEIGRVATGLAHAGIVAGHRVMLVLGNRVEFATSYLGVLRAQAVAVPVNPLSTPDEIARMILDSGARIVVADADSVARVREAVESGGPRVVVVGGTLRPGERSYDHLVADKARWLPPVRDPEALAALLYTSGTSGRPRAAMLTHRALVANIEQVARVEPPMIGSGDVVLGVLPLFHVYGLNAVLGGVLRHRAPLVLLERFDPVGTLDVVAEHGCTVLPLAPAALRRWLELDEQVLRERLARVRIVISGSAPLEPEDAAAMVERTGVPVHQGYGLTEAAPAVTSTLGSTAPPPGSVGRAFPGIHLRLVDEAGRAPEQGDAGEVQIWGDNLFSGYWPDGAEGPDPRGWWSTGDVGFLTEDGDLLLVDRVKDLVIVSGFNVYPVEVEEVLTEVDGVLEAAVIGVPDERTGEAVVAYVRAPGLDPGAVRTAVEEHCATRLAGFKRPSRVQVVDELPRTVTGKVQKGRLRGRERRRTELLDD